MNFDAFIHSKKLKASTSGRMLDAAVLVNILNFRIGNAAVVLEKRRKTSTSDIATFVDGSRKDSATKLTVPDWIIRPAAKE
jgi:hypothetical protein